MCGIAGYAGSREAAPLVLDCLMRLDYRGYDSCGIAVVGPQGLFHRKQQGRIGPFRDQVLALNPAGCVGVGHTRWATHGRADSLNAHPHLSCDGTIAAVHNGTLSNFDVLRSELEASGHRFLSTTDSEVIPHLLEESLRQGLDFDSAFLRLSEKLEGSFAIIVARQGTDELHLIRRESPLVVGVSMESHEYFPASDIPSFLPHAHSVLYIREGEGLVVSPRGILRLESISDKVQRLAVAHEPIAIDASTLESNLGPFEHFLLKEVNDQAGVLDIECRESLPLLHDLGVSLRESRDVWFVGAGSSYHACLLAEQFLGYGPWGHARACIASEFEHFQGHLREGATVVAVSQSGETADTVLAVQAAKERGARILGITSQPLSRLGRLSDVVVPMHSGREVSVAATKSYTSQIAILSLLVNSMKGMEEECRRTLLQARDTLYNLTSDSAREHITSIAHALEGSPNVFLIGRGPHYVTALESALKLKEVARLRAEAFPGGEMKHGPLALIEEGTPVFLFYDQGSRLKSELTASELHTRGARIFTVGPQALRLSADHLRVADAGAMTPLLQVVPFQMLAYELAVLRQLDPDHPRNLAKSVTVA